MCKEDWFGETVWNTLKGGGTEKGEGKQRS